ncbi:MAG TPA: putative LPS assembly protein LptD, partial [Anaerolineae bacterium]|nr:putative LPS assembly protein LptD [Anaerolineae bacterium]
AKTQNNPEKKFDFPGYVKSDSLEYKAESIDYSFDDHKIILNKNANIISLGRMLKSNTIIYYDDYEYMEAVGIEDSTGALVKTPVFSDKTGEELQGSKIMYSTKTGKGIVLNGQTEYEKGFMKAETIKRSSDDTLFVADGTYTTCDKEHPHFYFYGKKMKFILNDKLIIKPIIAYLHDVPVLWFPFYVFPIAKGRQSGFLTPRYGSSRLDGRYFSNIGYYSAPSDNLDYKVAGTLREFNGWLVNNWINYNSRYTMSGSIYGSYEVESQRGSRQWKLSGSHRHTISNTLSMTGRINLESSEFSRNNSPNLYQRLNRNMNSSMRISKKWRESGNSLITYISHTKNLDSKSRTTVAPSFSFSMPKKLIFGIEKTKGRQRKYTQKSTEIEKDDDKKWYETVYYSLNANFKNTEKDVYRLNSYTQKYNDHTFSSIKDMSIKTSLSSSNKFMGWLITNPSFALDENFFATTDSISYRREDNISLGLSLNTKVYGTFNPSIGSLKGLRHVISPSISYRYGKRRDYEGVDTEVLYRLDKNDNKKGRISSMNISLRNLFQAKTVNGDEERKFDLFTLDFSTGVDFEKDERPISPLRTILDIKPLNAAKIRLTASHTFYHDDDTFYLFSPYLNDMGITTTVGISDRRESQMDTSSRVNANKDLGRDIFETDIDETDQQEISSAKSSIPFNLRFTHYYKISRSRKLSSGNYQYKEIHTIQPNISFSPSKNFSIQYYLY